MSLLNRARIR